MARILVIDDDDAVRDSLGRMLGGAGYVVQPARSGEEGLAAARGGGFDVILSDLRMPGLSGIDVLRTLREARVDAAFIVMTGFGSVEVAVEAMKLGAVDFMQKPFFRDELLMRVRAAVDRRQLARQVDLLQKQIRPAGSLDALVGESVPMQRVRDVIRRAGAAAGTVLITGETGTGKELAARAIHASSPRAAGPFVALNCAAVTESLLESELFGHARGAFTGAETPRAGLIAHASGGTFFLDEIGTMSAPLQAKLLRTLESGEVRPIGSNDSRAVDVRFIAATNIDLQDAVRTGRFRQDLYYRLDVHHLHLPPLRERGDDVKLLVQHFLDRFGGAAGVSACSEEAWAVLCAYDYPGNVRQLEHVIQRAVAIAQGSAIERGDLPEAMLAARPVPAPVDGSVAGARERAEREMIVAALTRSRGEVTAAARDLQISRTTLWRLMKKHAIE